jgi:hypothetical protein
MTYRRDAGSTEAVLTDVLRLIAPAEIEAATGKTVDYLTKAANPMHRARLGFDDAAALDALCAEKGLGRPLTERWRVASRAGAAPAAADLDRELRQVTAELGTLAQTYDEAIADGEIEPAEAHRLVGASTSHLNAARRLYEKATGMLRPRVVDGGRS